jgi:hypothetical protein
MKPICPMIKYNDSGKPTTIFHGGCIRCISQDRFGVDRCKTCRYYTHNWEDSNLFIPNHIENSNNLEHINTLYDKEHEAELDKISWKIDYYFLVPPGLVTLRSVIESVIHKMKISFKKEYFPNHVNFMDSFEFIDWLESLSFDEITKLTERFHK